MSKLGPISHFLSPVACDSLVLKDLRCKGGAGVLNLVLSQSLSYTGHWKFNMAPHGKELSEDLKKRIVALHKDGVGYKKIAKTLKLSCSTVAKTIQRFHRTGSTQNRPRHGRPKKLSARAQRHIQRLCFGNRCMSAASIVAEVEEVGVQPVCAQTIPRTLHQIGLRGCLPRRKPLLKMMHKKACKQFAEDKQTKVMDYWNHVLWSKETKINLFGSDGVKRVWRQPGEEYKDKCVLPTACGGSVMVWVLPALGSYSSLREPWIPKCLKQSMIPSLLRLGRRAVFHHDNDPKHTSKMTTALLKKLRVKVICGASSNGRWRSAMSLTSTSSVMSSWRSGRGLQWQPVKLWWTPCRRGLRQCWKIMVATQNINTLGPIWTCSLRGLLTFVACGLDINGCVELFWGDSKFTLLYKLYTLLYIVAKCHLFSVVTWKDIKYLQKCEGCTHFCEILYIMYYSSKYWDLCDCLNVFKRSILCSPVYLNKILWKQ